MKDKKQVYRKFIAVLIALIIWQIAAKCIQQKILLVSPVEVFLRLLTIWREDGFLATIWFTLWHIAGGFVLGSVVGVLLAALAKSNTWIETLLWPWLATIKAVPVASFVVICLIWLSSQNLSIFISFLIVLPVVYQNTLAGLKAQSIQMEEMATVFHLHPLKKLRYVTLPQLKPYLLSAAELTTGMAWKAGVAAEIIGTPNGSIGQQLYLSKVFLDTDDLLAWTVIIVAISVVTEKIFLHLLRKVLH